MTMKALQALLALAVLAALAAMPAYAQVPPVTPPPTPVTQPPPTATPPAEPEPAPASIPPAPTPFDGNGMWIWYVSQSSGGSIDRIARRAQQAGVTTLFIKSSDGGNAWSQFNSRLVEALHARGLKACGWGYVYGRAPRAEARAARYAIQQGADCFVIDAETEYEGKYGAASIYTRKLRAYAGPDYPIGLAPFPYVDYHPGYPYSVFLGPGGAQFNLPQMYWRAIGTSVTNVYTRTYQYSALYGRPIYPLGQTYGGVSKRDVIRFRELATGYGARGVSWWSWQATTSKGWRALAAPVDAIPAGSQALPLPAPLGRGARGDLVVWAQQHLRSAGYSVRINGVLGRRTAKAVRTLQQRNALPVTGSIDAATWGVLLASPPAKIRWRKAGAGAAAAGTTPPPLSAKLPAKRDELRSAHR
jgi:hypothetical protein